VDETRSRRAKAKATPEASSMMVHSRRARQGEKGWSGYCSVRYVRGREAGETVFRPVVGIAKCNKEVILPLDFYGEVLSGRQIPR